MVKVECLAGECSHADKFVEHIVHRSFGIRYRRAGYEQAAVVGCGDDLEVRRVHNLHGVGEIGHEVADEEIAGLKSVRDALDDGIAGEKRLVAVDHHVKICLLTRRHLVEALSGGIMV